MCTQRKCIFVSILLKIQNRFSFFDYGEKLHPLSVFFDFGTTSLPEVFSWLLFVDVPFFSLILSLRSSFGVIDLTVFFEGLISSKTFSTNRHECQETNFKKECFESWVVCPNKQQWTKLIDKRNVHWSKLDEETILLSSFSWTVWWGLLSGVPTVSGVIFFWWIFGNERVREILKPNQTRCWCQHSTWKRIWKERTRLF